MKQYIKDMKPEEVIERLHKGEVIYNDNSDTQIYCINGVFCKVECGFLVINVAFTVSDCIPFYFETEEPFEIKETGLYKTRNGTKVFVASIHNDCEDDDLNYPVYGIIENTDELETWTIDGCVDMTQPKHRLDIVAKWEYE